ncbi:hypothetical protein [Streptomyces sp. MAR25Y5]|uniref:hypothetical protein n=1 Tax=Streptomyces sp. MAR25Y5 TaxID=2962028 RepID=UPI0020B71948|nr:hypothetical protein [Streptomyces sp. MAR25Y5]MCP3767691.1 hypothetical protein [Streptomyces sp. MAR25Y5]
MIDEIAFPAVEQTEGPVGDVSAWSTAAVPKGTVGSVFRRGPYPLAGLPSPAYGFSYGISVRMRMRGVETDSVAASGSVLVTRH